MYYNEDTIVYFNGKFMKAAAAKTSVYGQSLHYGYSVFEGIRSYGTKNGARIFKPEEHFDRFKFSAESVQIPYVYTTKELIEITYEVLERNNLTDAYIRPLLVCSPNMSLTKGKDAELLIAAWEWNSFLGNDPLRITVSPFARPNPKAFKVEAKVGGHYVNSIMAAQEAKDRGYDDALLLDVNGNIAEAPGANIFFEKDGVLYTPPTGNILPGITRATVFELCEALNIRVVEKTFTAEALKTADGAFFCGTAVEVLGLRSVDDVDFSKTFDETIGRHLQVAYADLVRERFSVEEKYAEAV
jgi:branched-chain amino acid aminotransferase